MAEFIADDHISERTVDTIESNDEKVSTEKSICKESNTIKYKIDERLVKWLKEKKEDKANISKTDHAKICWLRRFIEENTSLQSLNVLKSSLRDKTNQFEANEDHEEFFQQLRNENISKDNIYTMVSTTLKWNDLLQNLAEKKDIEKLKNDRLIIMFCTNATGSHKLPPYYTYEYETEKALKYLTASVKAISKSELDCLMKRGELFAEWYNHYFTKHVRKHQKKTNVNSKVILLLKDCPEFTPSEEIIKQSGFKILYFPLERSLIFQPLDTNFIGFLMRSNFNKMACVNPFDFGKYIKIIRESWESILSKDIESLWNRLFKSDSYTEYNTLSIIFINQLLEIIENVTEEDTSFKKVPDVQNSNKKFNTEECHKQQGNMDNIASNDVPEVLHSHAKPEEGELQKQLSDIWCRMRSLFSWNNEND